MRAQSGARSPKLESGYGRSKGPVQEIRIEHNDGSDASGRCRATSLNCSRAREQSQSSRLQAVGSGRSSGGKPRRSAHSAAVVDELRQHKAPVMALLKRRLAPPAPSIAPLLTPPERVVNGLNTKPSEFANIDNTAPPSPAPSSTAPASAPPMSPSLPSKRQREREEWRAAKQVILLYCRVRWGRAFNPWAPLPLTIGVREVIAGAAGDQFAAQPDRLVPALVDKTERVSRGHGPWRVAAQS